MATTEQTSTVYTVQIPVYGLNYGDRDYFTILVEVAKGKGYGEKRITIRPAGDGRGNMFNFTDSDPKMVQASAKALAEAYRIADAHEFKVPAKSTDQE